VLTAEDVAEVTAIVEGADILILSDQVYEHIIFDNRRHESMARHPELARRSFIVGSFGRTYHTTARSWGRPRKMLKLAAVREALKTRGCRPETCESRR
jgi:bifunctional pyridoxal-dependent enzyme with beta-cystathionase and maltose regulon repressor activities